MYYSEKDILRASVIPVLLGSSDEAFRLSWKIYFRSGIISYVCDERRSFSQMLNPFVHFFELGARSEPDILLESLAYFASERDYLPIIVPCNEFYRDFTKQYRDSLETKFIISDSKRFFEEKPMSIF